MVLTAIFVVTGKAIPDQEPHVDLYQLSDCQPDLRLSDQRDNDIAGQELWLQVYTK